MSYIEEELQREEQALKEKREYVEVRKAVTTMRCPICGAPLQGRVRGPMHDTADCQPFIFCDKNVGCGYFLAEGNWFSLYDKGAKKSLALQCLVDVVRPYIKVFGSPLENF